MAKEEEKTLADIAMPFLDHLEELRRRLFYCAIALAVGGVVAWALFAIVPRYVPGWDPIEFLQTPIAPYLKGRHLVAIGVGESFQIMLNVGFWIAFVVASPVILIQLWGFIAPAMYKHEKKIALPVALAIVGLFILGVVMAFEMILPRTIGFLLTIAPPSIDQMTSVTEYFGFAVYLCVGFGLMFELPIVIMGLTAAGLVTPTFLAKYRRYAFVGCLIGATFITPDPTAMFVISIPIYCLYEISILLSRMVIRAKKRREDAEENDEPPTPPPPGNPPRGLLSGSAPLDVEPDGGGPRRLGAPG